MEVTARNTSKQRSVRISAARRYFGLALLVLIAVQILPYLLLYDQSYLLIHDNLDANFVWYTILRDTGQLFASNDTVIAPIMGGVPRSTFPSEFSFTTIWFSLLPPLDAYLLEQAIQALVGFVGMYVLLRRHVIPGEQHSGIHAGVALTYGLLPFWPPGGLSVAGLPLLLYAFLCLRRGVRAWYLWLIIAIFPFYASLVLSGVFFIAIVGLLIFYDAVRLRQINWTMVGGLALLCGVFVFTHYRLFLSFFVESDYVSHRAEMVLTGTLTLEAALGLGSDLFLNGQYHAHSLHTLVILPLMLVAGFVIRRHRQFVIPFVSALLFIIITALWYRLWQWEAIDGVMEPLLATLPLNLGRFHYLHPMLWYVLFAISLVVIKMRLKTGRIILVVAICTQVVYVSLLYGPLGNINTPTFSAFFAEDQFAEIQSFIGQPVDEYRVVSIGIHPSIALYNGFYTLDGYMADYPLAHKQAFRDVIAPELAKNETLREAYDEWGSRAYILTDQLGQDFMHYQGNTTVLTDLDLNLGALWSMGGRYILSAVRIDTEHNDGYRFLRQFTHPDSAWDIYLYEIVHP